MANILIAPGHGSSMLGIVNDVQKHLATDYGPRIAHQIHGVGFDLDRALDESLRTPAPPNVWSQPVDYILGWLSWRSLQHEDWHPTALAGHSLGEFFALAASGAFDWPDGLRLVQQCGHDMDLQARNRPSAMTAVLGLKLKEVHNACESVRSDSSGCLQIANHNDVRQIVVGGDLHLVAAFEECLAGSGTVRTVRLNISGAAHCSLHDGSRSLDRMIRMMALSDPKVPVYLSTTAEPVTEARDAVKAVTGLLVNQVDWLRTIHRLEADYPGFSFRLAHEDRAMRRLVNRQINGRTLFAPSRETTAPNRSETTT